MVEGAADVACDELEGATPLQVARSVHATALAERGASGWIDWSRETGGTYRAEHGLALLLGIPAAEARTLRRGPVEAAGSGLDPSTWTYAYRGNLITADEHSVRDARAAGLSLDETEWLANALRDDAKETTVSLAVVGPARLVVAFDRMHGDVDPGFAPEPGAPLDGANEMPRRYGERAALMRRSRDVLSIQSINEVRVDLGENPANMLWLWGGGPPAVMGAPFSGRPVNAVMVSNSPLARGLAGLCGMPHVALGEPWSELAKPELPGLDRVAKLVRDHDLVIVYVEAPEEQGRFGSAMEKMKALDRVDFHVLRPLVEVIEREGDGLLALAALPEDGAEEAVTPFCCRGSTVVRDGVARWDELAAREGALGCRTAHGLLNIVLGET